MNRTCLTGRLTKDPDLRTTSGGNICCQFTLAVNRRFKSPGQPEADFIQCVAWNKTAELMGKYLHKGSQIGVEGRIQTRSYDNQQGQRVYVTEVVVENIDFLDPKNASQGANNTQGGSMYQRVQESPYRAPQTPDNGYSGIAIDDGDLPF